MTEWFVVRSHFKQAEKADQAAKDRGLQTILPMARVEKRRKDGLLTARLIPLLGNYLFIGVEAYQSWEAIRQIDSIKDILGYQPSQARPCPARNQDIDIFKAFLEAQPGGIIQMGLSRPKFLAPNTLVHILFGPFRDQSATVKADHGARVEVIMRMLGVNITHKLPRDALSIAMGLQQAN